VRLRSTTLAPRTVRGFTAGTRAVPPGRSPTFPARLRRPARATLGSRRRRRRLRASPRAHRRRCSTSRSPRPAPAPPTSPAPSTPMGRELLPARAPRQLGLRVVPVDLATWGDKNRRRRACTRAKWHGIIRKAMGAVYSATGDRQALTRWRSHFEHLHRRPARCRRSVPPAAPGARRWRLEAMRALPVGLPKVMVSTMALGRHPALCRAERHLQ
jgi:hypothetical protein